MEIKENELIAAAKAGDRRSFDRLVRMYKNKMFAHIYRLTGDREAALDLTQDTFFSVYKEIRKFREESSFSSWIYRIASNKAFNFIKRRKLVPFLSMSNESVREPSYEMPDRVEAGELNAKMQEAIGDLPPKQKLTFNLRFFDKLQFKEIARITGKSESTVKTNYQKAVEKLQKELKSFR